MYCPYLGFFFFSSRRRHTRYWRDWSSDVCSSDLLAALDQPMLVGGVVRPGLMQGAEIVPHQHVAFGPFVDRKSTRLNSSHANISYAVFCLKKKKKIQNAYE